MVKSEFRKSEGFEGQKAIVIPRSILNSRCEKNSIICTLYLTDIGYYPKARFHYRSRPGGADQHILVYCDKGEGKASVSGKEFQVLPGGFFIIPRKAAHLYSANSNNPWTIYWIHFTGTASDAIVTQMIKRQGGFKGELNYPESSIKLFNEIYTELEMGYGRDNLVYSNMCLSHFLTSFLFNEKFRSPMELREKNPVEDSIEYFRINLGRMLSLEEMADSARLSVSYYSSLFKKKTGFPPLEYFNQLKIQQACQYLLFTDMKIKDIAINLGMIDPYYFSRAFKRIMSISPKLYRESRANQP